MFSPMTPRPIEMIRNAVKQALIAKGIKSFLNLQKRFKAMDLDGSGFVNIHEFKQVLKESGIGMTNEVRLYFLASSISFRVSFRLLYCLGICEII